LEFLLVDLMFYDLALDVQLFTTAVTVSYALYFMMIP